MTIEQLKAEILLLNKENGKLVSELNFHKQLLKEVDQVIDLAKEFKANIDSNNVLQKLVRENDLLKSKLRIQKLSVREREVLKLILHGYTSEEMAITLQIKKLTVDTHRKEILQKMEVSNNTELIKLALASELI